MKCDQGKRRGFTLVETTVAFFLMAIIVSMLFFSFKTQVLTLSSFLKTVHRQLSLEHHYLLLSDLFKRIDWKKNPPVDIQKTSLKFYFSPDHAMPSSAKSCYLATVEWVGLHLYLTVEEIQGMEKRRLSHHELLTSVQAVNFTWHEVGQALTMDIQDGTDLLEWTFFLRPHHQSKHL